MKHGFLSRLVKGLLAFFLIAGLLSIFIPASAPVASADPDWWDPSWSKRAPITITYGENGCPENYQLRIFITYDSDMRSDFGDLRFLENEAAGILDYWIENYNAGENATVWVRREENADSTIYAYYGNASASTTENGSATFEYFEHFDGDYLDNVNTRIREQSTGGSVSVANSILTLKETSTASTHSWTSVESANKNFGPGYAFTYKVVNAAWSGGAWKQVSGGFFHGLGTDSWGYNSYGTVRFDSANQNASLDNAIITLVNVFTQGSSWAGYDTIRISWRSDMVKVFYNYNFSFSHTSTIPTITMENAACFVVDSCEDAGYAEENIDWVHVTKFIDPEPTSSVGSEEAPPGDFIITITCDNTLIDRDADFTTAILSTKLQAEIESTNAVVKENVQFVIYDALDVIVDNKTATENEYVTDNKQKFSAIYTSTDNTLSDGQLGNWDVRVEALDSIGQFRTNLFYSVFCVDDLQSTTNIENLAKHQMRTYGTVSRVSGIALTGLVQDNVLINDNNWPSENIHVSLTGNDWENIRAPPYSGTFYLTLESENLDGKTADVSYDFPNFLPEIISITSSQSLIDRDQDFAGSGAVLNTVLTSRIRDNDGAGDLNAARIAVRDVLDAVQENQDVWASKSAVDENQYDVSYTYNPADSLTDSQLGLFDVWGYAADNWASADEWQSDKFTVDDETSTISFNPTSPYLGWSLNVSGTISRITGGSVTVENSWLIDNVFGTWSLDTANPWSKTYTIDGGSLGENIKTTLRTKGAGLDGQSESSYLVNSDVSFQVELRWEDNAELVPSLADHNYRIKFWWDLDATEETAMLTISSNPENFTVATGGDSVFLARIYDNIPTALWRARVPLTQGGILVFLVPYTDATINQYAVTIEDYTQKFYNGFVRLYTGVGVVNEDWWDASFRSYAYLPLHGFFKVRMYSRDGLTQHEIQHFQAEDTYAVTWPVAFVEIDVRIIYKYEIIGVLGFRDENTGFVRAQWSCADENAQLVTVRVWNFGKTDNLTDPAEYAYPSSVSYEWIGAENDEQYWVEINTQHSVYGSWSDWFSIGVIISPVLTGPPGLSTGLPLPLAAIAGVFFVALVAMLFTREQASNAMLGIALTIGFLKILSVKIGVDLMPIPSALAIFIFTIAVIWKLGEGI